MIFSELISVKYLSINLDISLLDIFLSIEKRLIIILSVQPFLPLKQIETNFEIFVWSLIIVKNGLNISIRLLLINLSLIIKKGAFSTYSFVGLVARLEFANMLPTDLMDFQSERVYNPLQYLDQ